jgi:putative ABC transport system permease protein
VNLLTLSLKDLRRRRTRSALTVAGVALAAATLFSLLSFNSGYRLSLQKEMSDSGIHMFVSTEGCPMEAASMALHGGEIPKFLPEAHVPAIRSAPGVRAATSILLFSVPGESKRVDLFKGVDDEFPKLKPHWKFTGSWFTNEQSIVLGAEAARVEKRTVGDKVFFPELEAEFTVSGVLERTGSEDDGWFYIPLKTAQRIFKKEGKLTGVGVNLHNVEKLQQTKEALETIPDAYVVTAQQMMEQIMKLIGSSKTLMFAVLGIALAIAVLGVLNTVLMSVMEKLREFGYMRCVGASPGDIFIIVLTETVTLCLVGGVLGVIVGALGSSLADQLIRQVLPYVPAGKMVVFDASMLVLTLAVTVGIGALAGLYPSWKASHASPMEAIRNE